MRRSNQPILPTWLSFLLSVAFILASLAVIFFSFLTFQVIWNRPVNPVEAAVAEVADVELQLDQEGPAVVPTEVLTEGEPTPTLLPTSEPWAGEERVNILIMGIDRRPGESFVSRTDSIMLVSIDPVTNAASILSIPRDLYVVIPNRGRDRINTAFVYGANGDDPVRGAILSMKTVELNLGVHVNHYVLVDFGAVIRGIDALGGIDVNVPFTINDPTFPDMNYGYDPLFIPAGVQHLDGRTALKYARTRHVDNDFGRSQRQQQVVLAIRDKALSLGITGLITRAPTLYSQVEQGIRTDLSLEQIVRLGTTASGIPAENIRQAVLDFTYVSSHTTETGAQVLILDNQKAAPLIQELFFN